tara:strand:+ start:383 stop:1378 length:996 start_codon:yes stop_codon:yes gene_type:complete
MAKYKDIGGTPVGIRDGSESYPYPSPEGELYYNTSNGAFEFVGLGAGTWATGGNANTARLVYRQVSTNGTQNASIVFGGDTGSRVAICESYNGTAWTEVNDLQQARVSGAGFGTATAAIMCCGNDGPGSPTADCESWDGTSWSEINNVPERMVSNGGSGTQTAGLSGGGQTNDIARGTFVEVYAFDGTNWTETGDINTARGIAPFFGTQTASILASGQTDTASVANVEEFNGTSWTEIAEVNTVRQEHAAAGSVSTDAIIFAGSPTKANTEAWNGTAWTEVNDLGTARYALGGSGTGALGLASLGTTGGSGRLASTEEWTLAHPIKTVTTS